MSITDGFKIKSVRIDNLAEDFPGSDGWKVTVTNPRGQTLTRKFYKGSAHKGTEPEIMEFMNSMVMDASVVNHADSPEEMAEEFGYAMETPADRRKAKSIYNACVKIAARLETFLTGEEHEFFADY